MASNQVTMIVAALALVAGAFIASPELRAYAANTVFSSDIVDGEVKTPDLANSAVTAGKIKDGEVKAADIAGSAVTKSKLAANSVDGSKIVDESIQAADIAKNAVGADELQGVARLIFSECSYTNNVALAYRGTTSFPCSVPGALIGDDVVVTQNGVGTCYDLMGAYVDLDGRVRIFMAQDCEGQSVALGTAIFSIIVYHT